jgi:tetratricopeptide (TPR) repeat protein
MKRLLALLLLPLLISAPLPAQEKKAAAKPEKSTKSTKSSKPAAPTPAKEADKPAPSAPPGPALGLPDQKVAGALPPLTTGLSELASQAFARRDWKKARGYYQEMLKIDPLNALTHANLGAVEQQSGKLKDAQALFSRAVAINPDLQQTWVALGMVCYENGDLYLALSALGRAIHEDPTDSRSHNYLAIVLKKLGWLDAAEQELLRAIELNGDYANAHFNLALMYLERKPPAKELARRHYEKAVALGAAKDELVEEKLGEP